VRVRVCVCVCVGGWVHVCQGVSSRHEGCIEGERKVRGDGEVERGTGKGGEGDLNNSAVSGLGFRV
jgi:hypothetical protein